MSSTIVIWASQMAVVVKNLHAIAGDVRDSGSIPGLGRSPGEGHGNPLLYSWLKNLIDRGAWWAPVLRITESDMVDLAQWYRITLNASKQLNLVLFKDFSDKADLVKSYSSWNFTSEIKFLSKTCFSCYILSIFHLVWPSMEKDDYCFL